jgi:hypothetical protein
LAHADHEQLRAESIDALLSRLDNLKAQRAELDKAEKETVAILKEKLKQQQERLQKLGVNVPDTPAPTSCPVSGYSSSQ